MIHSKLILYILPGILILNQTVCSYKSDNYTLFGFRAWAKCICFFCNFRSIIFIYRKFGVVKFYFANIYNIVISINKQIDLNTVLCVFFNPTSICRMDSRNLYPAKCIIFLPVLATYRNFFTNKISCDTVISPKTHRI